MSLESPIGCSSNQEKEDFTEKLIRCEKSSLGLAHRKCQSPVKSIFTGSPIHGALGVSRQPDNSYCNHHHSTHTTLVQFHLLLFCPAPTPQQDILRLAGIQCQYSLRPQPVVQMWKLHHQGKMVLFQWKSTTLSKPSSAAQSWTAFGNWRGWSSSGEWRDGVATGYGVSPDGGSILYEQAFDLVLGWT